MKNKTIYPGYSKRPHNEEVIIEHTLRYADVDEIKAVIAKYGIKKCKLVWEQELIPDDRMKKLNYFLAKFIFKISFDEGELKKYMKAHSKKRGDRLHEIFNR
jgi:hypothetical protein